MGAGFQKFNPPSPEHITMQTMSAPLSHPTVRWPALVLLLGIAAAWFTWFYAARAEREDASEQFRQRAQRHAVQLEGFLERQVQPLRSAAALITHAGVEGKELFGAVAEELVGGASDAETLRYLAWAPRVPGSRLGDWVADHRRTRGSYRVLRLDGQPVEEATEHVVVERVWPGSRAASLVGLDLASDAVRRATFDAAREAGGSAVLISSTVRLIAPADEEPKTGVMVCVPVYDLSLELRTAEQRDEALRGYVVASFPLAGLLEAAFENEISGRFGPALNISIWDSGVLIGSVGRPPLLSGESEVLPVSVYGRSWRVETRPTAGEPLTVRQLFERLSIVLPVAVFVVLALCAGLVFTLVRQRVVIERRVADQTAELRESNETLERKEFELNDLNRRLMEMSNTDPLTAIPNRRAFEEQYDEERERSARSGSPFGLLLFDIDHFKGFNDLYGHVAGDDVLRKVARILHDEVRRIDCVARYGGEEFVIIAGGADANGLMALGERIRAKVQSSAIENASAPLGVITVSGGAALSDAVEGRDPRELIEIVDRCLYQAKSSGRNRVAMVS
jgi:diguanylate cyclase (GGDEF)-like protein